MYVEVMDIYIFISCYRKVVKRFNLYSEKKEVQFPLLNFQIASHEWLRIFTEDEGDGISHVHSLRSETQTVFTVGGYKSITH